MNDNLKKFLKEADAEGLFTGGLPITEKEYHNTVKLCRLITLILLIICITIILCDYFIF